MEEVRRDAEISPCGRFRYWLIREWRRDLPVLVACLLNPSDADGYKDDGTVRTLTGYARRWGYGSLVIVNLYARRAARPEVMFAEEERIGPDNATRLSAALALAENNGGKLLAAWGDDGDWQGEAAKFVTFARQASRVEFICLGTTKSGAPKHPAARGRSRPLPDQMPLPWPQPATPGGDALACTPAERVLLDTLATRPGHPALVELSVDGTSFVSQPE